ncbi:MAG: tyrosine-type recombinase/integrase [Spirochaetaceae bacterium]|jgi:integrase|nr:tyrosine-type recombinase/integrase [Spirochaetaceae bacterium]
MKQKKIRCSWRKDAGKFQVSFLWAPGKWFLTPVSTKQNREAAIIWAVENEKLLFNKIIYPHFPLFQDAVKGFFDIDGYFFLKKEKKGKHYDESFYRHKRGHLNHYILPFFKNFKINEISTFLCEQFTFSPALDDLSNETKNKIIDTLKDIFKPFVDKGLIAHNPVDGVERFGADRIERKPFTKAELKKLYPPDINKAIDLWCSPLNLLWGIVLRDTGCRPSEALAWTWNDYSDEHGGFVITKRMRDGEVRSGTKAGKRKYRAVLLSQMGKDLVALLKSSDTAARIFPFNKTNTGNAILHKALARAGIAAERRSQYCLRHTAVTQTIDIDRSFAQEIFGHASVKIQDNYDHPDNEQLFKRIAEKGADILKSRLEENE